MKLLLDENLPVKLQYRFREKGIEAFTVRDMEWLGKQNGELLSLMIDHHFDSFLTIDSIGMAIKAQNLPLFKKHFIFLTNTCNNCHQVTAHGFNVITIPTSLPVSNQQFKPSL